MSSSIISTIFDSTKMNPKLSKLFKNKAAENISDNKSSPSADTNENLTPTTVEAVDGSKKTETKTKKTKVYLDPVESEKRTIFIGNLVKECKKEVKTYSLI